MQQPCVLFTIKDFGIFNVSPFRLEHRQFDDIIIFGTHVNKVLTFENVRLLASSTCPILFVDCSKKKNIGLMRNLMEEMKISKQKAHVVRPLCAP